MDDILITSKGTYYSDHIAKLKAVLQRLEKAGFRANVRKCKFASDRVEYLGYEISRHGIHPQPKKVEAILKDAAAADKASTTTFLRYGKLLPRYVAEAIARPQVSPMEMDERMQRVIRIDQESSTRNAVKLS